MRVPGEEFLWFGFELGSEVLVLGILEKEGIGFGMGLGRI